MSLIQQEIHDLKVHLDLEKANKEVKFMKKIDTLKEQFRELLVEMRQRKAAEVESAVILSSDDDLVSTVESAVILSSDDDLVSTVESAVILSSDDDLVRTVVSTVILSSDDDLMSTIVSTVILS